MDTRTAEIDVEKELQELKARMPETYKSIVAKAVEIGSIAYALVRRGIKGEPNCFYAFERGYVKGTPFNILGIQEYTALNMVEFGCAHVCIFPLIEPSAGSGEVAPQ